MDQLLGVIYDLFVAGMETTPSTLTTAVNLMTKHPHVQRRVQKELDEVIGRDRLPSFSDMERQVAPHFSKKLSPFYHYKILLTHIKQRFLTWEVVLPRGRGKVKGEKIRKYYKSSLRGKLIIIYILIMLFITWCRNIYGHMAPNLMCELYYNNRQGYNYLKA